MKKPEEFLNNPGQAHEYNYNLLVLPYEDIITAMKEYAEYYVEESKKPKISYQHFHDMY